MKNMISSLSYGALNASYQVIRSFPEPTSRSPAPSCPLDFLPHTLVCRETCTPLPICRKREEQEKKGEDYSGWPEP